MTYDELKYKEARLRECFMDKLSMLDVDGSNDACTVRYIKTFGALWHYTHQLLMAEEKEHSESLNVTTADTLDLRTTGLKMARN